MLQTEGHKQYNLQDAHKHEYEVSDANEDDIKMKLILTQPALQFGIPKPVTHNVSMSAVKVVCRHSHGWWW